MYNSLYVILILNIILSNINSSRLNPSHCLLYLRHHQPSIGHYLLRIEYSINNEQTCEQRCSINYLCSMATYNRQFHRCHLFQHNQKRSLSNSYRSNYDYSTYANCSKRFSLSKNRQQRISNVHCNYDSLPWQHAQRSQSIIFKSYTLIGSSFLPCQELCSSVRHCAGVQFQIRGLHFNRCRLLRSTKPWDLVSSKTWNVFAKRSCYVQINENNLFSQDSKPLCNFKYFSQGQHKHNRDIIHTFSRTSEIQCQYLCSKIINCIGIEFIEKRWQCILLSSNFLDNDGSLDIKSRQHHHISMKISCNSISSYSPSLSKCPVNDIHCGCHEHSCQHGICLSQQREGYYYMLCNCHQGFTGHSCNQQIEKICPCLNGGLCLNDEQCQCLNGYSGDFCQIISEKF